ncbi:MAG TPA: HAMP domain-containing sensor histidine kinase [Candidatus Binatus sp.]|uniref:sensor histidine kinase n=1 Tax=Candidatus Binatus sp. TaxID=2811406 RepID=UPI002B4795F6|nr:HAMP domain-containing sensor histidine kinase [Candidatus Binatus sp.]HKN13503.1 HAMP domain-containing sensor histidine kinase [Candidatus Binatus sp.]
MTEGGKYNGSSGLTHSGLGRATSKFSWTEDDEESLRVLKLGGAFGIFMLLAYLAYDQQVLGPDAPGAGLHWLILAATCLLFGLSWTRSFKRRWKFWILLYNAFLIATFILISRATRDPESRFIAIMLCPLATAAFVSWGTRWQFAMALTAVIGYAAGEHFVPIETPFGAYRWMGLVAAVIFAQYTSIFIERYRRRLKKQVEDLEEAARFRQTQIATMAHDIRSPVAALSGYVNLLEEADISAKERTDLLGRIGSTAWNMDLVVSNVLDYYEAQDEAIVTAPVELDPNQVLGDVAEDCALQAQRRRLNLRVEIARLPACKLDGRHFEKIVRNMLAYAIGRTAAGEITLRAGVRNEMLAVEVTDSGPMLSQEQLEALFQRPNRNGDRGAARGLGLYIARAMAEAAGGRTEARFADGRRGLTLVAEFPLEAQATKARTP